MKPITQTDQVAPKNKTFNLLDSIKSPIVLLDSLYRILSFNSAFGELFNIRLEGLDSALTLAEIPLAEDLDPFVKGLSNLAEWTMSEKVFTPAVEPASHGWTLLLQDVSYYKRLNNNQSESMRYVLHDLRSPLTAIQGFASMMDSVGELNEKQKYFITKILSGVTQMTALVENVQDAGRYDPEAGSYELMRVPTDLGQIAHKIIDNHLVPADKSLSVTLTVGDNLPIIYADETMLQRAMNNLVDNAIKYTPDGGSINVSVTRLEDKLVVAVRDTGLGINPQNQAQLFERHSRIHRPEFKKIKGTGLGLFIVRSVALRHGGDAWVESEEGTGSTFFIRIPLNDRNMFSDGE